ncbi:hypothetical protein CVT24_013377 [Panaeolus cyanescens]|uniref:Uncharacterized protein n=1 Tax=Panaeolus cyanescens TaxID=181874 RepID=A0A409YNW6_9AGAR|nr:hypothetical protein CVT24_013377 [Panaeolus cyanescens]
MAHIRSRQSAFSQCSAITQHHRNLTQRIQRRPSLSPPSTSPDNTKLVTVSLPITLPVIYKKPHLKYHTMHVMRYESGLINGPDTVPAGAPGNFRRDNTQLTGLTGDYSRLGTESAEYFLVDTDPTSDTPPYDWPRSSGRQLRYGGRDFSSTDNLEAFGSMSTASEGPDGSACYGMV